MAGTSRKKKKTVSVVDKEIEEARSEFAEIRKSHCFPLLLGSTSIQGALVDSIYDDLRSGEYDCKSLDVIVDSGGGDIDAAYNLALLFRRYGAERLTFIIPRWAKSAATLLICGGDEILMTPVAELGPLDPQITEINPFEQRVEQFSPLHIESTLQLIRDEFSSGNSDLAQGLMERLQFPLTLGSFKKSLDIGRDYVFKLLSTRMLKENPEKAKEIGTALTSGYADHSWCITIREARELGLRAEEIENDALDVVWNMHKLTREKEEIIQTRREKEIKEKLKDLPPDLLDSLPQNLAGGKSADRGNPG